MPFLHWKYLLQLTAEAWYDVLVCTWLWVWIFDNVNLCKKVQYEREGKLVVAICMHTHPIYTFMYAVMIAHIQH